MYVDKFADIDMAVDLAFNSKTYRYGICGALETLLVSQEIAAEFLPLLHAKLIDKGVEVRGCSDTKKILSDVIDAVEEDWLTEYIAPILSIKIVADMDEAMEHIAHYGSGHTDAIVTDHFGNSQQFIRRVDSSSVMVNAATCFADGFEYGLGAEIGISTDRLHVRGPVGVEGLTTQKYVVLGQGTTR